MGHSAVLGRCAPIPIIVCSNSFEQLAQNQRFISISAVVETASVESSTVGSIALCNKSATGSSLGIFSSLFHVRSIVNSTSLFYIEQIQYPLFYLP